MAGTANTMRVTKEIDLQMNFHLRGLASVPSFHPQSECRLGAPAPEPHAITRTLQRVTMATPPARTQSLLSQALGKRSTAAGFCAGLGLSLIHI